MYKEIKYYLKENEKNKFIKKYQYKRKKLKTLNEKLEKRNKFKYNKCINFYNDKKYYYKLNYDYENKFKRNDKYFFISEIRKYFYENDNIFLNDIEINKNEINLIINENVYKKIDYEIFKKEIEKFINFLIENYKLKLNIMIFKENEKNFYNYICFIDIYYNETIFYNNDKKTIYKNFIEKKFLKNNYYEKIKI